MRPLRPLPRWDYTGYAPGTRYGDDTITYDAIAQAVDHPGWLVEDWGCGAGGLRPFITRATYCGIDAWAPPPLSDIQGDVRGRRTACDAVVLRHVLEHNDDWTLILRRACAVARHAVIVVTFTPWATGPTVNLGTVGDAPNLSLSLEEFEAIVQDVGFFIHQAQRWTTGTILQQEHLLELRRHE